MHSFWVLFFYLFLFFSFFEKFSQVAILKLEHCGLFYLVAYGCLYNSLFLWKWLSKLFFEKNLKKQKFRKFGFRKVYGRSTKFSKWETKNTRFCFRINKLSNAKKRNVLPSKLRPVKTFKVEKKLFRKASERWQSNYWHCLPADRSMVCVFWTAQHQHGQESVRNWAVRASGADIPIMDTKYEKKRLWLVETSFDVLWSAVIAEAASATIGSPLYPCQTYFPLSHDNGCHTMLKSRRRRIYFERKKKNLVDFQLVGYLNWCHEYGKVGQLVHCQLVSWLAEMGFIRFVGIYLKEIELWWLVRGSGRSGIDYYLI